MWLIREGVLGRRLRWRVLRLILGRGCGRWGGRWRVLRLGGILGVSNRSKVRAWRRVSAGVSSISTSRLEYCLALNGKKSTRQLIRW